MKDVAVLHSITEEPPSPQHKKRMSKCYDVGIVLEATGSRESTDSSQSMKVSFCFPILDAVIAKMQHRFDNKNLKLMNVFQCCAPDLPHFLDIDHLLPVVDLYHLNKESLTMECTIANRMLKDKETASINDIFSEIIPLKEAFPVLISLLQISLTVAAATADPFHA